LVCISNGSVRYKMSIVLEAQIPDVAEDLHGWWPSRFASLEDSTILLSAKGQQRHSWHSLVVREPSHPF
jgi:hypothetical protein